MDTPIFDQLHGEMFPQRIRYATDDEFREAYAVEKVRWAGLARRLAESGD